MKNIIKSILGFKGVSVSELAERLGKSTANMSQQLSRDDFRESDLQAIANALDCELVIKFIDRETGKEF